MKNSDLTVLAEWLATLGIYIIKINHEKNTIERNEIIVGKVDDIEYLKVSN